ARTTITRLDLGENLTKADACIPELKAIALQALNDWYPESRWLRIFTDGSFYESKECAGLECTVKPLASRAVLVALGWQIGGHKPCLKAIAWKTGFPRSCFDRSFKNEFLLDLQIKSDGKKWAGLVDKSEILPDHPHKETVAAIQIATEHNCLAEYLYKLGILPSPQCVICNEQDHTCGVMVSASGCETRWP
ncbi:hypothetical protein ANN_09644, partial [Periplaneta americana]